VYPNEGRSGNTVELEVGSVGVCKPAGLVIQMLATSLGGIRHERVADFNAAQSIQTYKALYTYMQPKIHVVTRQKLCAEVTAEAFSSLWSGSTIVEMKVEMGGNGTFIVYGGEIQRTKQSNGAGLESGSA
jgi:hypothetical protein